MNILLITQEDYLAGSTFSVSYLAKGLSAKGHRVVVAARPGSVLSQLLENTQVTFVPLTIRSRIDIRAIKALVALVRKFEIQVINAQSSRDRYITVLAKWLYRIPIVLLHTRRQISLSVGGLIQNLIYVNGTDKIVAVSEGVKRSLIEKRIPAKHIAVLFNGTPKEKYKNLNPEVVQSLVNKFSLIPQDIVIGSIARRKKQDQLLKALDQIGRPVKVIFVGIQEDEELKSIRASFKLPHQVYYEGDKEGAYALHYYKLFTCTVLCSTTEGLSQGLLESMYLGTPVIATAAAGNLDLVQNGENGLLFPDEDKATLANCIRSVTEDITLRQKLIQGGITTASDTFSIDRTILNYENLYSQLLSSRKF